MDRIRRTLVLLLAAVTAISAQVEDPDPCSSNVCLNGGTCVNINWVDYSCVCAEGYTGPWCRSIAADINAPVTEVFDTKGRVEKECSYGNYDYDFIRIQNKLAGFGEPQRGKRDVAYISGMCRTVMPQIVKSKYNISLILEGSEVEMEILQQAKEKAWGVLYNSVDADNFDFLLVHADAEANDPCYSTGYLKNGVGTLSRKVTCGKVTSLDPSSPLSVTASITGSNAVFKIRQAYEGDPTADPVTVTATPHFPAVGRIGLVVLNTVPMTVSSYSMNITYPSQGPPRLTKVFPTYGAQSGGTRLTLAGVSLPAVSRDIVYVKIGVRQCLVVTSSRYEVTALTPSFNDPYYGTGDEADLTPGEELSIRLYYPDSGLLIQAKETFRYKGDPVIKDFYPKYTLVGGGIALTVTGESLQSVAVHVMEVTMLYMKRATANDKYVVVSEETFTSECTVLSDTVMSCPTPHIDLPGSFANLTTSTEEDAEVRYRRDLDTDLKDVEMGLRSRRDTEDDDQVVISDTETNNERLEFYVSFKSDGVDTFKEQTEANTITVYANPFFEKFDEKIRKYDPNKSNPTIRIKGKYLTTGARRDDYHVRIGVGTYDVKSLTANVLICLPPGREPATNRTALGALHVEGAPGVTVLAGYVPSYIGHLDYTGVRTSSGSGLAVTMVTWICFMVLGNLI